MIKGRNIRIGDETIAMGSVTTVHWQGDTLNLTLKDGRQFSIAPGNGLDPREVEQAIMNRPMPRSFAGDREASPDVARPEDQ